MKMYKVLWIDDEWEKMSDFKEEWMTLHHIDLIPFDTSKKGLDYLKAHLDDIEAVLLDAKVPWDENERASLVGLRKATSYLKELKFKKYIPYFISTGQPDLMTTDLFRESFGDYYTKDIDDERLLKDMLECMDNREDAEIRVMYSDCFDALNDIESISQSKYFEKEVSVILLPILRALHNPSMHTEFEPRDKYNRLRQLVELIFRKCNDFKIIPDCCVEKGEVNLNQCQMYLSGRIAFIKKVYRYPFGEGLFPKHIENILYQVLSLGNINSHTFEVGENVELTEEEQEHVGQLLSSRDSRFIIFGFALQMIEVLIWLSKYLQTHRNIDENIGRLRSSCGKLAFDSQLGTCYFNEDFAIGGNAYDGDEFEITKYDIIKENTNSSTNYVYKYFIYVK